MISHNQSPPSRFRFGPFEVDRDEEVLRKFGSRVKLQKQPFQILTAMLAKPNQLISREELRELIWSNDTFVDFEQGLNAAINKLRQALGDSSANSRYIETVPGRGYRFIAPVEEVKVSVTEADGRNSPSATSATPIESENIALRSIAVLCVGLAIGVAIGWIVHGQFLHPSRGPLRQFTVSIPDNFSLEPAFSHRDFAISPDGRHLAYLVRSELWLYDLGTAKAFPVVKDRNVTNFAWSRDSQSLYFSDFSNVRKVSAGGGASVAIFEIPANRTWTDLIEREEGIALFTRSGEMFTVSEAGSATTAASHFDLPYIWPQMLPNRRLLHISFDRNTRSYQAWVSSLLRTEDRRQILETDSRVEYSPPLDGERWGHLFYVRAGTLVVQSFDEKSLHLVGDARPVAESVFWFQPSGAAAFSISENGLLVYQKWRNSSQLKWVDRRGNELETIGKPNSFLTPIRLSPDKTKLAAAIYESRKGGTDIWVYDLIRHSEGRLTNTIGQAASPVWAPNNEQIAFLHARGGYPQLRLTSLKGTGNEKAFLGASDPFELPTDWSHDGRNVLYQTSGSASPGAIIGLLDRAHQDKRISLHESSSPQVGGVFSPDDQWLAYLSNETGETEVYLQAFDSGAVPHLFGKRQRISDDGASLIRWRADGREIFYLDKHNWVTAVSVRRLNGELTSGKPQKLFLLKSFDTSGAVATGYDVSADGRRFIIADPLMAGNTEFVIIENWQRLIEP